LPPLLERELDLLTNVKVVVALGRIAFDAYLDVLKSRGAIRSARPSSSATTASFDAPGLPLLIACYHPSQQNTSTGKLTEKMLLAVFRRAAACCSGRRALSPRAGFEVQLNGMES